jgi:hypothetical protein
LITSDVLQDGPQTTVLFTGASAGAEGLFPNIDMLSQSLLPRSRVIGFADSGWFLSSPPFAPRKCTDAGKSFVISNVIVDCGHFKGDCTEQEGIQIGVELWNPVLNTQCDVFYSSAQRYLCLLGPTVYRFITTPLMIFQW